MNTVIFSLIRRYRLLPLLHFGGSYDSIALATPLTFLSPTLAFVQGFFLHFFTFLDVRRFYASVEVLGR